MEFLFIIFLLVLIIIVVSITYIVIYLNWKYGILAFSYEEEKEYRKLLCNQLNLDYHAFYYDSIESLEKMIQQSSGAVKELRKHIKQKRKLTIFGIMIDDNDITLRRLFFCKRETYSKASRYPSDSVYKHTSLRLFYFIPILSWKRINHEF